MANRYEYTVVELRENMIGGKMSVDKLQKVLNQHAAQGWQLRAITSVDVKGRVGPGAHLVPHRCRAADDPHRRGAGAALGPLTAAGVAGVAAEDAGAASGLVNVAYRLGGWLGLGILVTVFAAADTATFDPPHLFAHRVTVSLPVSAGMLAVALVLVLTLIVRGRRTTDVAGHRPVSQAASRA